MFELSNGIIDEKEVAAVLKVGPNHEVIFKSGQRQTIGPDEAAALSELLAGKKPKSS